MNPLARLNARIEQLEAARAELAAQAAPPSPPPAPAQDWESRLSAARAVDVLTGANTAETIESQRQADAAAREKQAKEAAKFAARATQTRESINALSRDLDAALSLLQQELTAAANARLPDCESDYHKARAAMMEASEVYAGCLALSGQQTAATQLLRAVGFTGDTMSLMHRRRNELRERLLNETEETEQHA